MKHALSSLAKAFKAVKPWQFLILTLISTAICVYALRANNEHMSQLRSAVYTADAKGGDVQTALQNLAKYVTSHMNTNLSSGPNGVYPPIQLTHSYERVTSGASQSADQQNSVLYTQAEDYCQAQVPQGFSGRYRIPCIEQYITTHSLQSVNIPTALYEFDFVSPFWSPDLAGWTLLTSLLLALLTIVSIIYRLFARNTKKA